MGEGEDEGENPRFDMPWHVTTLIGCNIFSLLQFLKTFVGA
jgi:hypothetical protein